MNEGNPDIPRRGDIVAGKYRVDRVLGEGGMGVVVAATHVQLEQRVALKFLLPSVVGHAQIVERFAREARAAVKIHSEHVARVLDVGTLASGSPYMVMEYLEGRDFADLIAQRGILPPDEAIGYVLQACEAIAEAHSQGIVHRDLKPANLFLANRPSGTPIAKVLDFGISKLPVSTQDVALTGAAGLIGSPNYMSPEQISAAQSVDTRTDVWAIGVVLYEMLTGRVPFQGESIIELIGTVIHAAHTPLRSLRAEVAPGLEAVIDRCLAKDRDRRYPNIAELAQALVPFGPPRSEQSVERIVGVLGLPKAPVEVRPVSVPPPKQGASTEVPISAPISPRAVQGPRRILFGVLAGGALLIGLALVVARRLTPTASVAPIALITPAASIAAEDSAIPTLSTSTASPGVAPSGSTATGSALPSLPPSTKASAGVPRPRASASSAAAPPPSASCRVVSFFDSEGNKHFKQECP